MLVDSRWSHFVRNIDSAVFAVVFSVEEVGASIKNFFQKIIAKALKCFSVLASKFEQGDDAKLLGLPLRNFHAQDLTNLANICRTERDASILHNNVEKQLAILRKRVRPRRKSSYKTEYAVDDRKRFFVFGFEKHSLFATGGDHFPFCEVNGILRFGCSIDRGRHYNVSETEKDKTEISGQFIDCHNTQHNVATTTHINMFSNDYF